MATGQLTGVNYSFDGSSVDFFGAKGARRTSGTWLINAFGSVMAEVSPDSIMPRVRGCIEGDVRDGNEDKIAQLQIGPRQAVVFFLEGELSVDDLSRAVEGPDFIDIPDVLVDGRSMTVRILRDPQYTVATADANGDVL